MVEWLHDLLRVGIIYSLIYNLFLIGNSRRTRESKKTGVFWILKTTSGCGIENLSRCFGVAVFGMHCWIFIMSLNELGTYSFDLRFCDAGVGLLKKTQACQDGVVARVWVAKLVNNPNLTKKNCSHECRQMLNKAVLCDNHHNCSPIPLSNILRSNAPNAWPQHQCIIQPCCRCQKSGIGHTQRLANTTGLMSPKQRGWFGHCGGSARERACAMSWANTRPRSGSERRSCKMDGAVQPRAQGRGDFGLFSNLRMAAKRSDPSLMHQASLCALYHILKLGA